jgi:signal transduction histidine kinase
MESTHASLAGTPRNAGAAPGPAMGAGSLRAWAWSLGLWILAAVVLAVSSWLAHELSDAPIAFSIELGAELSEFIPFAILTPFVYGAAARFPLDPDRLRPRILAHLGGGAAFAVVHDTLRSFTPYAFWDHKSNGWISALDTTRGFDFHWKTLGNMIIANGVEDILFVYAPIVLIAQAFAFHQRVREGERRKAQLESQLVLARLEALKSQLRPHFLFNTLHSISSLMLTDVAAADRMMVLLSDLLRMSLSDEGPLTALSEELEFVDTYLQIEKIRYEDRLRLSVQIAPDTLDALVPRLLLQPLVENAIRHGIAKRPDGGEVRICAAREARHLVLQVIDDGPGPVASPSKPAGAGLGLKATRERLLSLYGEDSAMTVESPGGTGFAVRLRLPFNVSAEHARPELPGQFARAAGNRSAG